MAASRKRGATKPDAMSVEQDKIMERTPQNVLPLTLLTAGQAYAFRTLGEIYAGVVVKEGPMGQLLLNQCSWIADTGRWGEFVGGKLPTEAEYEGDGCVVCWDHILRAVPLPLSALPKQTI